ncbi:MAG: hypothetical protein PHT94_00375 [Candidatus Nanoarchaeia archaeon]|nr:hypothetical protein [Candidatus Nanoarchaeia archaeon]
MDVNIEQLNEYKSLFKGKDLGLINQLRDFLKERNLEYRISGDSLNDLSEDLIRRYESIDIIVKNKSQVYKKYEAEKELFRATIGYVIESDPEFFSNVISVRGNVNYTYNNLNIETSFKISSKNPKTTINLIFEKD